MPGAGAAIEGDAMSDQTSGSSDHEDPIQLAQRVIEECERRSLAARPQRDQVQAMQDLNAELFRVRQRLELAELSAAENLARCVDLEGRLAEAVSRCDHFANEMQRQQAVAEKALQKHALELQRHETGSAALRAKLGECQARGLELNHLLEQVLASRSWTLTRPMRRLVERMRGRRWREPRLPGPID